MVTWAIPPGLLAVIGDWTVARIFHESGRLMKKHFGDMLLIMLLFTFPASLIKVWQSQFFLQDSEPVSIWDDVLYSAPDLAWGFLFTCTFGVTFQVLIERIYPDGERSRSFFTTLKSAFRRTKLVPPTDSESGSLSKDRTRGYGYNGNFCKGCGAYLVCVVLYIVISTSGVNFTPEAVEEMGLPPWSVFVFTVLVAAVTAFSMSYLQLTSLLVFVWTRVPALEHVKTCGSGCGDLHIVKQLESN